MGTAGTVKGEVVPAARGFAGGQGRCCFRFSPKYYLFIFTLKSIQFPCDKLFKSLSSGEPICSWECASERRNCELVACWRNE